MHKLFVQPFNINCWLQIPSFVVFRLFQDPARSAVGEGLVPSVLAFCKEESFAGANMAAVFGIQDKQVPLSLITLSLYSS